MQPLCHEYILKHTLAYQCRQCHSTTATRTFRQTLHWSTVD